MKDISRELRLGNYVRAKSPEMSKFEEPVKVCITYLEMYCRPKRGVDFEPIPLTEEWLIRFGFEGTEKVDIFIKSIQEFKLNKLAIYLHGDIFTAVILDYYTGRETTQLLPFQYKYVHQLQNLYFALTQTDLTPTP